eukprot:403334148
MYNCYICKCFSGDLCATCTNTHLEEIFTERDYVGQTMRKVKDHFEKHRMNQTKLELVRKIKLKKQEIKAKQELIRVRQESQKLQNQGIVQLKEQIEHEANVLCEHKQKLDENYQNSVEFFCKQDDLNIKQIGQLQYKVTSIKKHQLQLSQKLFDLFQMYKSFSLGEKEFKISKVNLLRQLNEFVLIDRYNFLRTDGDFLNVPTIDQTLQFDEEELYQTATNVNLQQSIDIINNYIDHNYLNSSKIMRQNMMQAFSAENIEQSQNSRNKFGRSRANTFEEFEKFQGDQSTDMGLGPSQKQVTINEKEKMKNKMQEAAKIKEEYASFITLNASDFPTTQPIYFDNDQDFHTRTIARQERIQGALHAMCLLIQGITRYLLVPLPYPIKLQKKGFYINDSANNTYPLYLMNNPDKILDTKQQIQFENAIILLDKNVQFLLYINGYELTQNSNNNKILSINELFDLQYLGRAFIVKPKKLPERKSRRLQGGQQQDSINQQQNYNFGLKNNHDFSKFNTNILRKQSTESIGSDNSQDYDVDHFEVLKLQNRQRSANQQLENLRTSNHDGSSPTPNGDGSSKLYHLETHKLHIMNRIGEVDEELEEGTCEVVNQNTLSMQQQNLQMKKVNSQTHGGNEKEWSDDDDYRELISNIRKIDLSQFLLNDNHLNN